VASMISGPIPSPFATVIFVISVILIVDGTKLWRFIYRFLFIFAMKIINIIYELHFKPVASIPENCPNWKRDQSC
jgi:hypothetical protein